MPNYNLSYPGSSGYGVNSAGRYGRLTSTPSSTPAATPAYAIYDVSSGKAINSQTRELFNGRDPMSGKTFQGGVEMKAPGLDPNNVAERYQPVEVIRSPETASATQTLMDTFKKNAASSLEDFGSYLRNFKTDLESARTLSREATDINPTVEALTSAQQSYGANLDASNAAYRQALADAAASQRGVVDQANATLPMYDTALKNILSNELDRVQRNVSRYKMGSATPRSLGSAETQLLTRGALEASLPIEQARINRRYDILSGLTMPTESAIAGRDVAYAGGFLPSIAGSRYGSETGLATAIQSLRQQVASMSYEDAVKYMGAIGVPAELQTRILSGQISNLGGLNALEEASRYRGLQDLMGVNVSQPVGYDMSLPGYPQFPTGTSRYATPNLGANAPATVAPPRAITPSLPPAGTRYQRNAAGNIVAVSPDVLPNYFGV